MNSIRDQIAVAVAKPTLRVDEPPRDGAVRTPLPRLALRIGLTGHRPDRLNSAAGRVGMSAAGYESNLADRLTTVFSDIELAVSAAQREIAAGSEDRPKPCFDQISRPLLRLVSGLALGTDTIAMRVVDERFRGSKREDSDSIHMVRRIRADDAKAAEWQIDGILPCKLSNFAIDAIPDISASPTEVSDETLVDHWRKVVAIPDTLVALPAQWRLEAVSGPRRPPIDQTTLEALKGIAPGNLAGIEEPPDIHHRTSEQLRLDYGPAGAFLLRQIDILVVVWDGEPSRGPGGAPDIVAAAVDLGVPVLMIDADEPQMSARLVRAVEREVGPQVSGWHPRALVPKLVDGIDGYAAVRHAVGKVLVPPSSEPSSTHSHGDHRTERDKLADFLGEAWPTHSEARTYRSFQDLMTGRSKHPWADRLNLLGSKPSPVSDDARHWSDDEWRDFILDNPDEGFQAVRLKRILHRRYVATDLLAVKYADLYRGAFIKAYLWSAVAVALAILGFVFAILIGDIWSKASLVIAELWVIYRIWRKVHDGEREHLHEKFVHYRALAESLRHMRFLATFAEYGGAGSTASGREVWWGWYLRATMRELGLPSGQLDAAFQSSLLQAVAKHEVDSQIEYHTRTARLEAATDDAVHRWGHRLFKLTTWVLLVAIGAVVVLFVHATIKAWPVASAMDLTLKKHLPDWAKAVVIWGKIVVGMVASIAPALGAALAGIRFTADFDGKAASSVEMGHALEAVRGEIAAVSAMPEFARSSAALRRTAEVLADDVGAFLAIFGRKPLTLPG